ncbi:hypothetical protein MMC31_005118 [Peltigera leucophlebia]|nr:hypothetical protein [Peltigera leucophlebia]
MYLLTLALLVTSASANADLFRRWDYSPMEPSPALQKRQIVTCPKSPTGDTSCAATCGVGYDSCIGGDHPICFNESKGESCCGNGVLCFTGYYCDPKGCCPNGVLSSDCVTSVIGPLTIASSASVAQATGSSSSTKSSGADTNHVNNEALGLVLGGLGVLLTL